MSQDVSDAISILACALRLRHHSGYDVLDAIENLDGVRLILFHFRDHLC